MVKWGTGREAKVKRSTQPRGLGGYNSNVQHRGSVFHIQTEDSGIDNPYITTHLYDDRGAILSTKKSSYAQLINDGGCDDAHRHRMIQDQHDTMYHALRAGRFVHLWVPPATRANKTRRNMTPPMPMQSVANIAVEQPLGEASSGLVRIGNGQLIDTFTDAPAPRLAAFATAAASLFDTAGMDWDAAFGRVATADFNGSDEPEAMVVISSRHVHVAHRSLRDGDVALVAVAPRTRRVGFIVAEARAELHAFESAAEDHAY